MSACIIMPTVPRRSASAAEVVRRLLPQADAMIVHLNGHTDVPAWARDKRIRAIPHAAGTGPIVRLSVVPEPGIDHVLFVDDDLAYPPDYVARNVAALKRLGPSNAVCYHAAYWPKGTQPAYAQRRVVMYSDQVAKDLRVPLMGSGTACFHRSDLLRIDRSAPKLFEYHDDVWTSASCAREGIRLIRVPSARNWIMPLGAAHDDDPSVEGEQQNAYVNQDAAMAAAHEMGGWNISL